MNKNELFNNIISLRRGASAVGVRRELQTESIPEEIKQILKAKKANASK
jgi:hypothetical protein